MKFRDFPRQLFNGSLEELLHQIWALGDSSLQSYTKFLMKREISLTVTKWTVVLERETGHMNASTIICVWVIVIDLRKLEVSTISLLGNISYEVVASEMIEYRNPATSDYHRD